MRRATFFLLLAQSVGVPAAVFADSPAALPSSIGHTITEGDWPGFLGPTRNGKSTERGLPAVWPAGGPAVVWRTDIGTGYAAPAISAGRLFHFARFGDAARLSCFNAETGVTLWTRDHPTDYEDMLGYNNGPRA